MKKVYLIHGWGGSSSSEGWFGWLEKELKKRKIELVMFNMPETDNPKIEKWIGFLKKNVKDVDEQTYFVGHSIGCQAILRFLEKLHRHKKIGGCVFVAPWLDLINLEPEEMEIAHPWINSKIDFARINDHCTKFLAIFSDNDPYVPLSNVKLFKDKLRAKTIIKHNQEHFNETEKIPEILEFL